MRTNSMKVICGALIALAIGTSSVWAAKKPKAVPQTPLTEAGQRLETRYADQLKRLRTELTARVPQNDQAKADTLNKFLASDALDAKFAKYVVLLEATPQGLAAFTQQGKEQAALVEKMLADADLMKQILVADGANAKREGRGYGPAQYGQAMKIYIEIQSVSKKAASGVLQRLALAISLEHAVPIGQANPTAQTDAPETSDPVKRYLHYEKAYLDGELDPAFERLSTWELRMVVNGDEPDETLAWGREMLRNYRPDHIYNSNFGWRYVSIVGSDVKYGSGNVKYDRPELQKYQNILGWQRFKFGVNNVSINPTVPYMEVDPRKRSIKYRGNPCPDRKSLYRLTDLEWVTRTFKDNVYLASRLRRLTDSKAGKPVPATDYDDETLNRYGLFATNGIIDKVKRYGEKTGRKILFVLSYGGYVVQQFIDTGRRFDQSMVDHLDALKVPYVDLLAAHAADRKQFRTSTADYLRRFFVGHYNPLGNHFCAFAMVEPLARMLDPKPASHGPAPSVRGGFIK